METVLNSVKKYAELFPRTYYSEIGSFVGQHKLAVAVSAAVFVYGAWYLKRPKNLPPGPYGYPVIGSLPVILGDFLGNLTTLREKYGDIVCLWFGFNKYFVVLNKYELIREVYVTRGLEFTSRNQMGQFYSFPFKDTIFGCPYNAKYKYTTKLLHQAFRDHTLHSMDRYFQAEMVKFESHFESCNMEDNPLQIFNKVFGNIMLGILLNKTYPHDDADYEDFISAVQNWTDVFMIGLFYKFLHSLTRPLMWGHIGKSSKSTKLLRQKVRKLFEGCKEITSSSSNSKDCVAQVFLKDSVLDEEEIVDNIITLLPDCFQSLSSFCYWIFAYLINYPEYQVDIAREISDLKGGLDVAVATADRHIMPVTESFILEVLRMVSPAPTGVQTSLAKDTTIGGYTIPKYAEIVPNFHQVHFDPEWFPEPYIFKPERFVYEGKILNPTGFMPFGIGRRMCLGQSIAINELFLMIANVIRKYKILPSSEGPPQLKKTALMQVATPFKIKLELRKQ